MTRAQGHSPRTAPAGALRSRQRGLTLFGLIFWAMLIGFGGYMLVRILPTINEYSTIRRAVDVIAKTQPSTVAGWGSAARRSRPATSPASGWSCSTATGVATPARSTWCCATARSWCSAR